MQEIRIIPKTIKGEIITITVKDWNGRPIFTAKADMNNSRQVEDAIIGLSQSMGLDLKSIIKKAKEKELNFFGMTWKAR